MEDCGQKIMSICLKTYPKNIDFKPFIEKECNVDNYSYTQSGKKSHSQAIIQWFT